MSGLADGKRKDVGVASRAKKHGDLDELPACRRWLVCVVIGIIGNIGF